MAIYQASPQNKIFAGTLTLGYCIAIGTLSFIGMWLIWPILPLAAASFVFAGTTDGKIYWQNTLKGLVRIRKKDYVERMLEKELEMLFLNHPSCQQNEFYQAYIWLKNELVDLENNQEDPLRQEKLRRQLKAMHAYVYEYLYPSKKSGEKVRIFDEALKSLLPQQEKEKLVAKFDKKTLWTRLTWLGVGAAGFCAIFVNAYAMTDMLLKVGIVLSGATMAAFVWPLAIIAAVAYTIVIYSTLCDIIQNEKVRQWYQQYQLLTGNKKILYGFLAAVTIAFALFATFATAGTWWEIAKLGARLVPSISNFAAALFRSIMVPFMAISTLVFNFSNSIDSAGELTHNWRGILFGWIDNLKKNIHEAWERENFWQLIDLPRVIIEVVSLPFKFFSFMFHIFSIGVMNDRVPGLTNLQCAIGASGGELFEDLHYFVPKSHGSSEHKHTAHAHAHAHAHTHAHTCVHSSSHSPKSKPHPHLHDQNPSVHKNCDHEHTDIAENLLMMVFTPLYIFSALWQSGFSQLNEDPNKCLSFQQALKRSGYFPSIIQSVFSEETNPSGQVSVEYKPIPAAVQKWTKQYQIEQLQQLSEHYQTEESVAKEKKASIVQHISFLQNESETLPDEEKLFAAPSQTALNESTSVSRSRDHSRSSEGLELDEKAHSRNSQSLTESSTSVSEERTSSLSALSAVLRKNRSTLFYKEKTYGLQVWEQAVVDCDLNVSAAAG